MSKRARTQSAPRRAKRPIDKQMPNVTLTAIVAAQQAATLYAAASFPGTITGLRWDFSVVRTTNTGSALSAMRWAIVIVPQSTTASTISMTNGAALYAPEQNVLAYGAVNSFCQTAAGFPEPQHVMGSTKAMRKLKAGDSLQFLVYGTATEAHAIDGCVQFFYKT